MAYNMPSGDVNRLTIGPGIILLGPSGATPTVDVGYVKGEMVLSVTRAITQIRQGTPQTIVQSLANQEDVMVEFKGLQWNLDALLHAIGDGATSASNPNDLLKFGGRHTVAAKALRFTHRMADGSTVIFDMWKCQTDGNVQVNIDPTNPHEISFKFNALDPGTTDWGGAALTDGQKLAKVTIVRA